MIPIHEQHNLYLFFCVLTIRKQLPGNDFERSGRGQEPSRGHKFSRIENFLSIRDFTSQTLASFPSDLVGACLPQTLLGTDEEELCQIDTIPPTATDTSVRKQIAERNNVSESYVVRSEKFMRGVQIMDQMIPGMQEKILSGQFKVRAADMHRLARADFPNRKQIVHEILHPEERPAPQKRIYGINYSALEAAVRRIQQDVDFLMKYLPKVPDDAYVKVETTKILKQHKAYMAQFEEMLNDEKVA